MASQRTNLVSNEAVVDVAAGSIELLKSSSVELVS